MAEDHDIPADHPRAASLQARKQLIKHFRDGVVASAGLIAHGRGEAFDYLLGETSTAPSRKAVEAAAAALLKAEHPVISVNGNTAALAAEEVASLAKTVDAKVEVNLFYRSLEREHAIRRVLEEKGVEKVYGVGESASAKLPEIGSERRWVDPEGILAADVVLVPLEDGDRAEALVRLGKTVIAVDLNPLSRTAQLASITIVDNVERAMPLLAEASSRLKKEHSAKLEEISSIYDNRKVLGEAISLIQQRLTKLAEKGVYISLADEM